MENRVPIAAARNQLSELVAQVESEHNRVTLTRHGKDVAVLIAQDELDSIEQTLELYIMDAAAEGKIVQTIHQSDEDLKEGRVVNTEQLSESLERRTAQ